MGRPMTNVGREQPGCFCEPDHLLGAAAFEAPLFALKIVAAKIDAVGDRVVREQHEIVGDDIPTAARRPNWYIEESDKIIDGMRIEHRRLRGAETEDALIAALPDADVIIVQDLVYNRAHWFLGERRLDGWREALRQYRDLPYHCVLPGHGLPGGKPLYDEMIDYLDFAEAALVRSSTAEPMCASTLSCWPSGGWVGERSRASNLYVRHQVLLRLSGCDPPALLHLDGSIRRARPAKRTTPRPAPASPPENANLRDPGLSSTCP
jgi:glyoxylase-like metal-dependent hydrolase (beta-lactamase superfamily II)